MKAIRYIITFLSVCLFLTVCPLSWADNPTNNAVAGVTNTVTMPADSVLSKALAEVLMGAKDVGNEMYGLSKLALFRAYDLLQQEAPQVVEEFIHWKIAAACVWATGWAIVSILLFWAARSLWRQSRDPDLERWKQTNCIGSSWTLGIFGTIIGLAGVGSQIYQLCFITIAPRIYIISYLYGLVQEARGRR